MDRKQHEEVAKTWFAALGHGDPETTMATMLADDASYWILPSFLKLVDKLVEAQSAPLQLEYDEITAQGDRVAIVVRGHSP